MSEKYTITIVIDTDEDPSAVLDRVQFLATQGGFLESFIEGEIDPDEVAVESERRRRTIEATKVLGDLSGRCDSCGRSKTGPKPRGPVAVEYEIQTGDRAWNPASTKRMVSGPARLTYTRWPDGGVDLKVSQLTEVAR